MTELADPRRSFAGATIVPLPPDLLRGPQPGERYPGRRRPAAVQRERPRGLLATIALWQVRIRERCELLALAARESDSALRDVGITREEAVFLGRRPFWRA